MKNKKIRNGKSEKKNGKTEKKTEKSAKKRKAKSKSHSPGFETTILIAKIKSK